MEIAEEKEQQQFRMSVRRRLANTKWRRGNPETIDYMSQYSQRLTRRGFREPINVMRPSPGSKKVQYNVQYLNLPGEDPELRYHVTHQLRPETLELLKTLPMDQVTHRGRVATCGSKLLQLKEMQRRVLLPRENWSRVEPRILNDSVSTSLATQFAGITLKHMTMDVENINKYRANHKDSSFVSGMKWSMSPPAPDPIYDEIFEFCRGWLEKWESGDLFSSFPAMPTFMGLRARTTGKITSRLTKEIVSFGGDEDRSRVVNFEAAFSGISMFIRDHHKYYDECLRLGLDVFKPNFPGKYMSPLVQGGDVYFEVADHLSSGEKEPLIIQLGDDLNIVRNGEIQPWDGKTAESYAGIVLGKGFWPIMTTWGGMAQLPSGIWCTSIMDMYMMMRMWGNGLEKGKDLEGIVEWQTEDYDVQFLLGLRYKDNPQMPRLQGIKLTADTPKASSSMPPMGELALSGHHDQPTVERWAASYTGLLPDGQTILDELRDIVAEKEYFDPSEFVSRVI